MRMAKAVMEFLKANGVECIFGIPAGTISPLYDALNDVRIKSIITKNEAGAAYMAARYASTSGKLGVCVGAGGVGVNNMINGIADAMRAKAPVLVISGYINRRQIGKGAIQELDTKDILKPITKYSETVLDERQVLQELENAFRIALTPPCGPVHISIPIDVQLAEIAERTPVKVDTKLLQDIKPSDSDLQRAAEIISKESDGLIMVGKGCRHLSEQVMELSEHLQWPIITTPEGKGVIPSDFYLNLGNYGFASTDAAFEFVERGDFSCLLVLGTSMGEASTCNFSKNLVDGKRLIHVDWDIKELGKVYEPEVAVHGDLKEFIPYIINNTPGYVLKFQKPDINMPYEENHTAISLRLTLETITDILPSNTYYVCDMGEFMNFVFKYLQIPEGGDFEVNVNYASMGSGIGGVIGVQMAQPHRPIAVISGDGSFFMNGTEILTAKEYGLPIIYIIVNNAMLAYVEHGHQFLYGRVVEGFKQERISICDMMNAVGVKAMQLNNIEDLNLVDSFVKDLDGPCVIEVNTDGSERAPILDRLKALSKSN